MRPIDPKPWTCGRDVRIPLATGHRQPPAFFSLGRFWRPVYKPAPCILHGAWITLLAKMNLPLIQTLALLPLLALGSCAPQPNSEDHVYPTEIKVTHLLQTRVDSAGHQLEYPKTGDAELTAVLVEIPVGATTGWHIHTVPCAAYMLEGEVHIELADGSQRVVKQGQAFAEVVDLLHNGRNPGPKTAKLVLFVAGKKEMAYTLKKAPPSARRK